MIRSYISKKYKISLEDAKRCEKEARQSLGLRGDNSDNSGAKEFEKVQKKAEHFAAQVAAGNATEQQKQAQLAKQQKLLREQTSLALVVNSNGSLSHSRYALPFLLDHAKVPEARWKRIHAAVSSQLCPAVVQAREIKDRAVTTILQYLRGFKAGSDRKEQETMQQIMVAANLSNGAVVKATNVVSLANYLLNDRGIMVEIEYESSKPLESARQEYFRDYEFVLPVGIRMSLIGKDDPYEEEEEELLRA